MLNTSSEWQQAIVNGNRRFKNRVQIISPNGSGDWQLTVNSDKIMQGGAQYSNASTSTGNFDIGSAIVGKYTLLLQNYNEEFLDYIFEDATVIAYVGLELEDHTEWVRKGTYTVNTARFNNGIVTLTCYDYMNKFARNIPEGALNVPTTLNDLLRQVCSRCGVVLASSNLKMRNYVVNSIGEKTTFLDAIAYISQIEGVFARCNYLGQLELIWYDVDVFSRGSLDGGTFIYTDGDFADGGAFNPWNVGFEFDSGDFKDMDGPWLITSFTSNNIDIEDVVLTGIQIESTNGNEPFSYMAGAEGYVLSIVNNEFITEGTAQIVAEHLRDKIAGMRFRPYKLSILGDPAMEVGDSVQIVNRNGSVVQSYLTNIDYTIGSKTNVSCDAKSAVRKSADRNSLLTKAVVQARNNTEQQISDYDLAMQQLTSLITQSFGLFKTDEEQEDGSVIFYMHNKPLLKDSMTIWKMTADAFAVSTDGGKTWNAGMDSSGNAVVNVLSAIGINFDWARGGTLTLGGQNNTNGVLRMLDGDGVEIGKWDKDGIDILVERTDAGDQFFGRYITLGRGRAGSYAKAFDLREHLGGSSISHFSVGWDGHVWARNATIWGSIQSSGEFGEVTVHGDGYVMGRHAPRGGGPVLSNPVGYISFNTFFIDNNDIPGTRVAGRGGIALFAPVLGVGAYTPVNQDGVYVTGQTGTIPIVASITDLGGGRIGWESMHLTFTKGLMTTIL